MTTSAEEQEVITFHLGDCMVQVWPAGRYLQTLFRDASTVPAAPQDNEEYRQRAHDLGYGADTWAMCLEHELFHTLLAQAKGLKYSPVLWDVAHGITRPEHGEEEAEVLEFQRKLNAARHG